MVRRGATGHFQLVSIKLGWPYCPSRAERKAWAWQPLQAIKPPELPADHPLANWVRTDVDRFIAVTSRSRPVATGGRRQQTRLLRRLSLT